MNRGPTLRLVPDGMRIDAIELRIVALPLVTPFVAAHGTTSVRTAVITRVLGPDGEGWGECAALPEPTYTDEYVDGAFAVLRDDLGPRLLAAGADGITAAGVRELFGSVIDHPMARASLELALLDAECTATGVDLAHRFSAGARSPVPAGVAIGLLGSPGATATAAADRVAEGYQRIKLKIEPGRDLEILRSVREAIGPGIDLMADANGSYTLEDTALLTGLDEFGLTCIEQPLTTGGADDPGGLRAHAALATRIATPICLDESLVSMDRTEAALSMGACSVVCVKAPRFGTWLGAIEVLELCQRSGVDAWIGGMLDTGLGRLANLALAAHPAATLTGDISATARFFTADICAPVTIDGGPGAGTIAVPDHAGFISALDHGSLERHTIAITTVRP
jgi:O-succinylbenzoate synthase